MTDSPAAVTDPLNGHCDGIPNKLQPTLDDIQKRFSCSISELLAWRNALVFRYSGITDNSVTVETSDFDNDMHELPSSKEWVVDLPTNLAKTVIRLYSSSSKRITVTLYYVPGQSSGTLLCQGKDCALWDSYECERLKSLITKYVTDHDSAAFLKALLRVPLVFVQPYERLSLKTPDVNIVSSDRGVDVQLNSPASTPDTVSLSDLLSCDNAPQASSDVVIFPPTPVVKPKEHKLHRSTPCGLNTKRQRRRTLCFTPIKEKGLTSSLIHTCAHRLSQVETSLDDLTAAYQSTQDTFVSLIEDAKIAIKK